MILLQGKYSHYLHITVRKNETKGDKLLKAIQQGSQDTSKALSYFFTIDCNI